MKLLLRLILLSFLVFSSIAIATYSDTSSAWASSSDDDDHDDDDDDDDDDDERKYRFKNLKSLSSVIRQFNRSGKGRFLDVKVTRKKGAYYYKITYIGKNGKVGKAYYIASKNAKGQNPSDTNPNFNKSRD